MQEDFLHYCWKFKKFDFQHVKTTEGEELCFFSGGVHNENAAGPDFFNAKLKIGGQLWVGNVEIHIRSADWYVHHHETDPAYDNVILHVVWEHDIDIFRKDNSVIPTLQLCDFVAPEVYENYQELLDRDGVNRWINCEASFAEFSDFTLQNWMERLYVERLEAKSLVIHKLLNASANNWEEVLFWLLAKNFGLHANGAFFLTVAQSIPFSVIRKCKRSEALEALFFGQAHMLQGDFEAPYFLQLKKEYAYLKSKYQLEPVDQLKVEFFRLRPPNFPTIRFSQFAALYQQVPHLFSKIMNIGQLDDFYSLFTVQASSFWQSHYTFGKNSKKSPKKLTKNFIDLLLINTVIPLKFCYAKATGAEKIEYLLEMMRHLKPEKNKVSKGFNRLRQKTVTHAMDSQAVLQLKKEYCDKNRCLHCNLGLQLLQKEK